jgi:ferredoxin-NADP reductase
MNKVAPDEILTEDRMELLTALFQDRQETVTKRKKAAAQTRNETSLQLLFRLFGTDIYDCFPESLMESAEKMREWSKEHVDAYVITKFETEQDKLNSLGLLRAYGEIAPDGGYTVRVDWDSAPNVLHWKITTRRRIKTTAGSEDE